MPRVTFSTDDNYGEQAKIIFDNAEVRGFVEPASGSYVPTLNPATEEELSRIAEAGREDLDAAVALLAIAWVAAYPASYQLMELVHDRSRKRPDTSRYALPLVVPVGYLAVTGVSLVGTMPAAGFVAVVALASILVDDRVGVGYAKSSAPAFRMLADMEKWRKVVAASGAKSF